MTLVGKRVRHKKWGIGTIVNETEGKISVEFPEEGVKPFQFPNAFETFLKFEDEADQTEVDSEIARINQEKEAEAEQRRQAEEARNEELRRQAEEARNRRDDRAFVPAVRVPGEPSTFLVFQGTTFAEESKGGFIWAPKNTSAGSTCHHWDRLLDIREGDVVFHCADGYIKAVSCAKGPCFDDERPAMFEDWEKYGRRANLEYIVLDKPIKHGDYKAEIMKYVGVKYFPFDRNGDGVMGYFFDLNKELAKYFLAEATKKNPKLRTVPFLQFLY